MSRKKCSHFENENQFLKDLFRKIESEQTNINKKTSEETIIEATNAFKMSNIVKVEKGLNEGSRVYEQFIKNEIQNF